MEFRAEIRGATGAESDETVLHVEVEFRGILDINLVFSFKVREHYVQEDYDEQELQGVVGGLHLLPDDRLSVRLKLRVVEEVSAAG